MLIQMQGKLLFIRNSYGNHGWTFPGGAKKRDESPEAGAIREAKEEVGITISSAKYIGSYYNSRQFKRDTVYCFLARIEDARVSLDPQEVVEFRWFKLHEVPEWHSQSLIDILPLYIASTNSVPRGTNQ